MSARVFTLQEARQTLPRVKALMATMMAARQAILSLRPEAWPAIQQAASNGGSQAAGEMAMHIGKLEQAVKAMMGLGIQVKNLDHGIIDFVGKRDGREVYLCWRYGEEELAFWHEINAGFAGRQPIDGRIE